MCEKERVSVCEKERESVCVRERESEFVCEKERAMFPSACISHLSIYLVISISLYLPI